MTAIASFFRYDGSGGSSRVESAQTGSFTVPELAPEKQKPKRHQANCHAHDSPLALYGIGHSAALKVVGRFFGGTLLTFGVIL